MSAPTRKRATAESLLSFTTLEDLRRTFIEQFVAHAIHFTEP